MVPTVLNDALRVVLAMVRVGVWVALTVIWFDGTGAIGGPEGGVAVTLAMLTTEPASRSTWVTVCVPVHVVLAPGASVVAAQVTPAVLASVTLTAVTVTMG